MAKKIVSFGMLLAADGVDHVEFNTNDSLLDWDIILFRPDIHDFTSYHGGMTEYKGKLCLDDYNSFALKESSAHWRREIKEAVELGKTVIVHLCRPENVFVQTGNKKFSGTGRNQKTTNIVEPFSNYEAIPISTKWTAGRGREIVIRSEYKEVLASYWDRFGPLSTYEVTFSEADKIKCLLTRHGSKAVALHLVSAGDAGGNLLLLPDLDFGPKNFFNSEPDEDDADWEPFTDEARQFAATYIAEIVALDRALRQSIERSVEPGWAKAQSYIFAEEERLQERLLLAEEAVERAQKEKDNLKADLVEAGHLRGLLFETGKPLEAVILKALRTLGFEAESFQDGANEFDAVFSSAEGRLLGEAEGKDNKAINITKLRQLNMNIEEDFGRDEVDVRAKGVLFGNAYRLTAPADRDAPFTGKCIASAIAQSIALVHTPDLFAVTRHVMESGDADFARQCREVLVSSVGLVSFPPVPEAAEEVEQIEMARSLRRRASATVE
ncbi:hypothetical protein SAMN05421763_103314 [[Luteovulum] sphaeroides subsp. megalophilum]|uniref:hypothetical protein n=1 Tax=Cereibacter sphaeroides TaxID=1063 RepID=UPI000B6EA802|nr:hypothetical protein [Cereibacter sphaeroides]SNS87537.1 hypothetical protein SAMN05421763_103314 [[Luteovulum] sphaeroides subsp. megalophilum]